MDALRNNLRYIDAERLRTTDDPLCNSTVMSPTGKIIGKLAGALIDPARRHVPFLIVESRRWFVTHSYAVPFGTARFDHDLNAVLLDNEGEELREVHGSQFQPFGDDDLITALFSTRAA